MAIKCQTLNEVASKNPFEIMSASSTDFAETFK